VGLILGLDIGQEQASKGSSKLNVWYSPVVILKISPVKNWAFAFRGEYYNDENGVIIYSGTANGFKTFGASVNIDRSIGEHFLWRTEFRTLTSKDAVFLKDNSLKKNNSAITTSLALTF
jgi:hypothetical protein